MKSHWKVPFRNVISTTFWGMVKQTIWCHFVIKLWPNLIDVDSSPEFALEDEQKFAEQYRFMLARVRAKRHLISA